MGVGPSPSGGPSCAQVPEKRTGKKNKRLAYDAMIVEVERDKLVLHMLDPPQGAHCTVLELEFRRIKS